jgi:hypothetical protein
VVLQTELPKPAQCLDGASEGANAVRALVPTPTIPTAMAKVVLGEMPKRASEVRGAPGRWVLINPHKYFNFSYGGATPRAIIAPTSVVKTCGGQDDGSWLE